MITTKAQKQEMVTALATRLRAARTVYLTDFTGLDVAQITQLRRRLRQADTDFVVVKNTLALRAFGDAQVQGLDEHLAGPTGLVLTGADPAAAAKVLADFAKENEERPAVKGGLLDGKSLDVAQVKKLANMPSREQMLAQLAGGLQSPLQAMLGAMSGLMSMMVGALEARRMQLEKQGS